MALGVKQKDEFGRELHSDGSLAIKRSPFRPECRRVGAYDSDEVSVETGIDFEGQVSLTQQSQAEETDINGIVKRFRVTGILPEGIRRPTYGDFDGISDFRTAMEAMMSAERSFMAMPSDVRAKFDNDPQKFVDFCSNEANLEEMRKLGLAVPKKEEATPPAS